MLDADTFTSPESHEIALLAAGAAIEAARHARRHWRAGAGAGASAGPSRRAGSGDGLLSVQQHRRRRGRASRRRRRARRHRRHRRAPRQRHAGGVLRGPDGAVRLEPPVPVLPGHGRGRTRRAQARARASPSTCRWRRARPTPTIARVHGRRPARARRVPAGVMLVSAGFDAHELRSARRHAHDDRGLRASGRPARRRRRARCADAAWRSSPKAATTWPPSATACDAAIAVLA